MPPKAVVFSFLSLVAASSCSDSNAEPDSDKGQPELTLISTYRTGVFDDGAAEIIAYHPQTKRIFSVNGGAGAIDILDISDIKNPKKIKSVEVGSGGVTCVAAREEFIVATVAAEGLGAGEVVFLNSDGEILNKLEVGSLPDHVAVSKDSKYVLVCNEGEPSDDYKEDPVGSISLIEMGEDIAKMDQSAVTTIGFEGLTREGLDKSVRIFGPGATVAQDLEPEYGRFTPEGDKAYVVCQENNAMAIIDVPNKKLVAVKGLGFVDHSKPGFGFDSSDKSDSIDIKPQPTKGIYQPDAFDIKTIGGKNYLVLTNEGDARDYEGFSEEIRVEDLKLDPKAFPNAEELQKPENLGRLKTTTTMGDTDGDGDHDEIYSYGARSFSIRDEDLNLLYDSGNSLAKNALKALEGREDTKDPKFFKGRSDDKGVEPEAVAVGELNGKTYAFIGMERLGGIAVYDISTPEKPNFVTYAINRDFSADIDSPEAGDVAPECILFIPADESPNGEALIAISNEVSGTISFFSFK